MNHKNSEQIPTTWLHFLEWFCPPDLHEGIVGDVLEAFERDVQDLGVRRARKRFAFKVISFFRPGIVLRNKFSTGFIHIDMLKNYFKIAIKNLSVHRLNSFINIVGLSIGIACALLIAYIVKYDLSFDSFHTNAPSIYRVVRVSEVEGQTEYRTGTSLPLAPAMKAEIAALRDITSVAYWGNGQIDVIGSDGNSVNKFLENDGGAFVDNAFFKVFDFRGKDFKWIEGNPETALKEPNSVVLSESMAHKYFGNEDPLGRILRVRGKLDVTVTGVVSDLPPNTDFPFSVFISYSTLKKMVGDSATTDWGSVDDGNQTYIVLPSGVSKQEMEQQIARVHTAHAPNLAKMRHYLLQPLDEVHEDSRYGNYRNQTISKKTIWTLSLSGLFLLIMACINFVNLSVARSIARSKEVGIRKVIGGSRFQIIVQFVVETFIITACAAILALIASEIFVPKLQGIFDFKVQGLLINHLFIIKILVLMIVAVTLLAGLYPAIMQSGISPALILKNKVSSKITKGIQFSNVLILFQFTITLIFVTGTIVIYSQMQYFNRLDLGFDKNAVINVPMPDSKPSLLSSFRNQLNSNPRISEICFSSTTPSGQHRNQNSTDIRRKGSPAENNLVFECQMVGANYINLYKIKLVAGRNLSLADTGRSILINQTLLKKLGFKDPEEAVGSEVLMGGNALNVVGVVEDFHTGSLKDGLDKVGLLVNPRAFHVASIKLSVPSGGLKAGDIQNAIASIRKVWTTTYPDRVFDYGFLDKNIEAFYQEELRFSTLFQLLSGIFLLIGCLGLYGLISFIINKRMKEVAVRKAWERPCQGFCCCYPKTTLNWLLGHFALPRR